MRRICRQLRRRAATRHVALSGKCSAVGRSNAGAAVTTEFVLGLTSQSAAAGCCCRSRAHELLGCCSESAVCVSPVLQPPQPHLGAMASWRRLQYRCRTVSQSRWKPKGTAPCYGRCNSAVQKQISKCGDIAVPLWKMHRWRSLGIVLAATRHNGRAAVLFQPTAVARWACHPAASQLGSQSLNLQATQEHGTAHILEVIRLREVRLWR